MMISLKGGKDTMKQRAILFTLIFMAVAFLPAMLSAQEKKEKTSPKAAAEAASTTATASDDATSEAAIAWQKVKDKFGKEVDEAQPGSSLFAKLEDVEKYLKKKPDYIYPVGEMRNPMVIPWRRREIIANQLIDAAQKALDKSEFDRVGEICSRVMQEYPGTENAKTAEKLRVEAQLRNDRLKPPDDVNTSKTPTSVKPTHKPFPEEVKSRITGIIWSEKPQVLMGDEILDTGKSVPGYPDVIIKRVEKRAVVFGYYDEVHTAPVDAGLPEMKGIILKKN